MNADSSSASLLQFGQSLSARHSLTSMDDLVWLRWGVLLLLWLALAYWHYRQNRAFHDYIRNKRQRTPLSDRLSQLAYNRSFGILSLYAVLLLAMGYYDTRINALQQQQAETLAQLDSAELVLAEQAARPATLPVSSPLTDEALQEALDDLKPRYENLFIHYHVLKRCRLASPEDFHMMNSALLHELSRISATAEVQPSILQAARGSYTELYAELSCDAPEIPAMQKAMEEYLTGVTSAFPDE